MAFEILVSGVGDAFSLDHYGTHFMLRKDDYLLAIDCPDGFRHGLKEHRFDEEQTEPIGVDDVDALYLTHLHGDHVNGLEMTVAYRTMALQQPPLPIYGIPAVLDDLWPRRLQASLGQMYDGKTIKKVDAETFFELRPLSVETCNQIGPFEVELRTTNHHIPTTAMRISDGEHRISYSCDTAYDPELIRWLADDSDLIFHECTFGAAHTGLPDLQELKPSIRKRLVLVHYSDNMVGIETGIRMAKQGEVFVVGSQ